MGKAIGIDLGTTYSAMAHFDNGQFNIIPNSRGNRVTPSIVAFTGKGEILVGESAKNQAIVNSDRTIIGIKRKMGSSKPVTIGDKSLLPQVISSYLLAKLKEDAESFFGENVTDAVITVPAYFTDTQRQATIDAGKIAGLNVLRIINEPTSAALAYGFNKDGSQRILVYDLGGGTFDVSILELDNGVFEVIATRGNNALGGMDFDKALSDVIIKQFKEKTLIDLSRDKLALQKLNDEVEKAKIALSDQLEVEINIPFITADRTGPKHLEFEISRKEFESLIEQYINETVELIKLTAEDAGIEIGELDKIILVGGSTRIPLVTKKIEEFTKKKVYKGINPDEVVALGAAIQCGIIQGKVGGVVLADVTPFSLGIEVEGDLFVPIIKRNNPIPTIEKKIFTTIVDNQDEVEIHILQGEKKSASLNVSLGKFILAGIRKAKKGVPRIEVSFNIDVNSIVNVTAKDIDTLKVQEIIINSRVGFSQGEIDSLNIEVAQLKKHNESNLKFTRLKNEVKALAAQIEKLSKENPVDAKFHSEIESIIIAVNKAIDNKDMEELNKNSRILHDFFDELKSVNTSENNLPETVRDNYGEYDR